MLVDLEALMDYFSSCEMEALSQDIYIEGKDTKYIRGRAGEGGWRIKGKGGGTVLYDVDEYV